MFLEQRSHYYHGLLGLYRKLRCQDSMRIMRLSDSAALIADIGSKPASLPPFVPNTTTDHGGDKSGRAVTFRPRTFRLV